MKLTQIIVINGVKSQVLIYMVDKIGRRFREEMRTLAVYSMTPFIYSDDQRINKTKCKV